MTTPRPFVIIVDDDDVDVYLIRKAFERSDAFATLLHLRSGREFFEHLEKASRTAGGTSEARWPDVILLDINMPEMNGFDVLDKLRSDPSTHPIPVIMLTTSEVEESVLESYSRGANSYIVKPTSIAGMKAFVDAFEAYWFRLVTLPRPRAGGSRF